MKFSADQKSKKPHAVFVPFPTQGHINPLLKLAKLIHHRGFYITFVNTEYNHKRLLKSNGSSFLENLPDFRFETIPDGLPPSDADDATQHVPSLCDSTSKYCLAPFRQLLARINASPDSTIPPVTCVVADGVMTFTVQASLELNIPNVLFWTFGVCGFMSLKLCADLRKRGVTPFKDSSFLTDGSLEALVDWVPGLKNFRLKHVANFIQTADPHDIMLDFLKGEIEATSKASAVILYTFDALERDLLEAMSPLFPPIYTVGPLQLLVDQIQDENVGSMECSLWKAKEDCIQWLNSKEKNSVLYVNFGSIVVLTPTQSRELAMGLAGSNKSFLWIIRPDLVQGNSAVLPPGFVEETEDRGLTVGWCSQEKVLNHPAVGGFLTHCGWNSVVEGMTAGVPFLCFPLFSEQPTNCWFICNEWGNGLEVSKDFDRDEIERLVRELFDGESGEKMRKRATELKKKASEATSRPDGSSFLNLEKLVKEVLLVETSG